MNKSLFTLCFTIVISSFISNSLSAQRHFFRRFDVGTDNIYTYVMSVMATSIVNVATEYPLMEPNWNWAIVSSDGSLKLYNSLDRDINEETGEESIPDALNPTAHNLFSNITAGGKMGYISDSRGSVNFAVYGSAHYNFRQLKTENYMNGLINHKISRAQIGGGILLTFGSIERNTRFIIDSGVRYNIPIGYKGNSNASCNDVLNQGLSSHYSMKLSFGDLGLAVGFGFNCMHYNLFKDESLAGHDNKIHEIVMTVMIFSPGN